MIPQLVGRALDLHRAGRLAEAEALYRQALATGGGDAGLHYQHATVLYQLQRPQEALSAVEMARARAPGAPEILTLHGVLLHMTGRSSEALASLSRVTASGRANAEAWHLQGVVLSALSRFDEAVAAFDRALALQPSPLVWNDRALALRRLGRFGEALDSLDRAMATAPNLATALFNRSLILSDLGRHAEALEAVDRLLAREPGATEGWATRAALLFSLERDAEAVDSANHALRLQPENAKAWAYRGYALQRLARPGEALASLDRSLAALPDQPEVWRRRCAVLVSLQRLDEALIAIQRAIELNPTDPAAQFTCGKLLCELGRIDEGLDRFASRARQVYGDGGGPEEPAQASDAKQRHDEEQRAYLAKRGVAATGFHIDGGDRIAGPAVNPANSAIVAEQWALSRPQMVVIDNLLTAPALEGLRRFCWGSTVWRRAYRQGYLGAFAEHGFACPLLAQIAEELREVFPTVVGGQGLGTAWAFKYDSRMGGIDVHADEAAVNVNFWITPDAANLNPDRGGMVVWDAIAPADWDFGRFNGDRESIDAFLAAAQARSVTVPYRENRAVIFDSDLFHKTDEIDFRAGYENRRINVTMLYGRRISSTPPPAQLIGSARS